MPSAPARSASLLVNSLRERTSAVWRQREPEYELGTAAEQMDTTTLLSLVAHLQCTVPVPPRLQSSSRE